MGFFKWFASKAKMKRWISLILLGIVLFCYGISTLIYHDTLGTAEIIKIIVSFVVGFTAIVIGFVFTQKRTLELLIEESDARKDSQIVNSLIFNKKVYNQGPKVVVIGGGSGLNTVLRGLKNYTDNITAIVTVSEYGKKPTNSRKTLQLLPLSEIKESLVALSHNEKEVENLLNTEFMAGPLAGLNFGDIYFSAMNQNYKNVSKSIENSREVLNITGKVLPVTLEEVKICAELDDGTVIEDKNKIADYVSETANEINRIYINPTNTTPAPGVIEAIKDADVVVIGPGSLYINVIPNLLVKGVAKAIKESQAMKVYVCNIMTELGLTDEYTLSDHIQVINDYVGQGVVEYCIYDTGEIIPELIKQYNLKGSDIVLPDEQKAKEMGVRLIQRDLSKVEGDSIIHDPNAIAETIIQLVCDELKFRDMQNDSKFVLINSKLKERKKENKKIQKAKPKEHKKSFERNPNLPKSKFNTKYQDRVESIKNSRKNTKLKRDIKEVDKAIKGIVDDDEIEDTIVELKKENTEKGLKQGKTEKKIKTDKTNKIERPRRFK